MRESSEFFVQAITVTKNAFTSTAGAFCAAGEQGWGALRFTLCCWPEAGVWAVRLKPSLAGFAQGNWGRMKPTNNWICSDFSCHLCQFKKSEPVNEPQPSAFGSCCISLKGLRWKAVGLLACFLIKLFLLSGTILLLFFFSHARSDVLSECGCAFGGQHKVWSPVCAPHLLQHPCPCAAAPTPPRSQPPSCSGTSLKLPEIHLTARGAAYFWANSSCLSRENRGCGWLTLPLCFRHRLQPKWRFL